MKLLSKNKQMLVKKNEPEGISFKFTGDIQIKFPLNSNAAKTISMLLTDGEKWLELERIWSDGHLQEQGINSWIVSYEIYEKYDFEEDKSVFESLELPLPEKLDMEVNSHSHVGDPSFRITVEASHPVFGALRDGETPRYGSAFYISEDNIIPLTKEQRELFDEAKGEEVDWNTLEERMAYLAKVKKSSFEVNAKLDGYLQNEDYNFQTTVSLDIREDSNDEITLIPKIDGIEDYGVKSGEELVTETPCLFGKRAWKITLAEVSSVISH